MRNRLLLSAAPPERWRDNSGASAPAGREWRNTRARILSRDGHSCRFCGFTSPKYMEVHHLGGDALDDSEDNLMTLCPLCHACLHVGLTGIRGAGRLVSGTDMSQEEINRGALEACRIGGMYLASEFVRSIEFDRDAGSQGLILLANDLNAGMIEDDVRSGLRMLPEMREFRIAEYLDREREMVGESNSL